MLAEVGQSWRAAQLHRLFIDPASFSVISTFFTRDMLARSAWPSKELEKLEKLAGSIKSWRRLAEAATSPSEELEKLVVVMKLAQW